MLYEFRKENTKSKPKANKRQKHKNKKLTTKNEKAKLKNIPNNTSTKNKDEYQPKDRDTTREDIIISQDTKIGYIAGKTWKTFQILNKIDNKILEATANTKLPDHLQKSFIIGDKISYNNQDQQTIIQKREKRKNYISKTRSNTARFWSREEQIIAANIDIVIIVSPVKNPTFDHKLIDRYLVLCQNRWVTPIICLNKIDLTNKKHPMINQYKKTWIKIIEISTITKIWIPQLQKLLQNKTAIFLWKSWVWKSSITNILHPQAQQITQDVNQKSWEWKHTTTTSNLYPRTTNSYIIDTPGIRALGIDQIAKSDLKNLFPEFTKYKNLCKYRQCLHESEPDCAIKTAVKNKKISQLRYDSYLRILKDLV